MLSKLALKHRQGKNHKMRIIAFVGSPVEDHEKDVSPQPQAEPAFGNVPQYLESGGRWMSDFSVVSTFGWLLNFCVFCEASSVLNI